MKLRLADKQKAVRLRKQGHSYKEIMGVIHNLPKSTLSGWCNQIELTPSQVKNLKKRISDKMDKARFMAGITNHRKRLNREKIIFAIAEKKFNKYKNDPLFAFGLALYWAEGAKKYRNFQFMNSDPILIKIMGRWVEKYLEIDKMSLKFRLYTHDIFKHENHEMFWSKSLNIPIKNFSKTVYKSTPHILKKNPQYKGCLRIEISKTAIWLTVLKWMKLYEETLRL